MAQHVDPNRWRGTVRGRLLVVALLFLVWALAIQARLVIVQVAHRDYWVRKANNQQLRVVRPPARRGEIVDRNGELLAKSVEWPSLAVDPRLALDPNLDGNPKLVVDPKKAVAALCKELEDCSPEESRELVAKFKPGERYLPVRERISLRQAARLSERNKQGERRLPWVDLSPRPWRFYPNKKLAAHVLGTVDIDGRGIAGVELRYDKEYLTGRPGSQIVLQTHDRVALQREGEPPVPGDTLELTIDRYLQFETEAALREVVATYHASAGCALVMATRSGEILALANLPTFNPNLRYAHATDEEKRNRVVQDAYEPGSTFKVVTATAALEQKVIRPDDIVDTGNGSIRIGNHTVSDTHAHGSMTFREVITKSSNVGASIVGKRLGRERLGRYVLGLGFGRRLLPDIARGGESAGQVADPATWRDEKVQTVAYGYGISATPLQLATAVNAIANGGELVRPRLLRAVIRGDRRTSVPREVIGRAMLPDTAAQLTEILEGVTVQGGTATTAAIDGYTVAGKTGTAQKIVNAEYSTANHRGSFIGFVPSRDPVVTVLVMLDNPHGRGYYGGVVAAPAFKRIAEAALRRFAVPPTINPPPSVLVEAPRRMVPVAGPTHPLTIVPARPLGQGELLLPELVGMSGRTALLALSRLGLGARITGDGVVIAQEPAAGTPMEPGSLCRLWLSRVVPNPPPGSRP
jgi:cell division protein FtsI (penicillin-binding protein 3)